MENDRYNFGKHYIVLDTKLENHINSKNNPHNVTKADVDLNKVENRVLEREVTENSENYVTSGAVYTVTADLQRQIDDIGTGADLVHIHGDETIEGSKTFNASTIFNNSVVYTIDTDPGIIKWEFGKESNLLTYTYTDKLEESNNYNYDYVLPIFDKDEIPEGRDSKLNANFVIEKSQVTGDKQKHFTVGETKLAHRSSYIQRIGSANYTLYANASGFKLTENIDRVEDKREEEFNYTLPEKTGYFVIDNLPDEKDEYRHVIYNIKKVTWSRLKELRDESKLIPGQFYQITDYKTTTIQENTESAGHQFDIIVQALAENVLSEDAKATYHFDENGNPDGYFINNNAVESYEFINPDIQPEDIDILYKYRPDGKTYGSEAAPKNKVIDEITFLNLNGIETPALHNPDPNQEASHPVDNCYYIFKDKVNFESYKNNLVSIQYVLKDNDEIYYLESRNTLSTVFVKLDYETVGEEIPTTVPVLYKEDSDILIADRNSVDEGVIYFYIGDYTLDGIKYNRWSKYNKINDHFVKTNLEILTQVIVEDGDFIITQEDLDNAIFLDSITYDRWESCYREGSIRKDGFTFLSNEVVKINTKPVKNVDMQAWNLKYCLDNDSFRFGWTADRQGIQFYRDSSDSYVCAVRYPEADIDDKFAWAFIFASVDAEIKWNEIQDFTPSTPLQIFFTTTEDPELVTVVYREDYISVESKQIYTPYSPKGVIYFMKDEWGNEAPYDFKNILFKRYKINRILNPITATFDFDSILNEWSVQSILNSYLCSTSTTSSCVEPDQNNFKMFYTLSYLNRYDNNNILDISIFGNNGYLKGEDMTIVGIKDNKISPIKWGNESTDNRYILPNNVFLCDDPYTFYSLHNAEVKQSKYNTFRINGQSSFLIEDSFSNIIDESANGYIKTSSNNLVLKVSESNLFNVSSSIISTFSSNLNNIVSSVIYQGQHLNMKNCSDIAIKDVYTSDLLNSNVIIFGNQSELKQFSNIKIDNCQFIYLDYDIDTDWVKNVNLHKGIRNRTITLHEGQVSEYYETNIYANNSKDIILDD